LLPQIINELFGVKDSTWFIFAAQKPQGSCVSHIKVASLQDWFAGF
jgi:hypothetical protein